MNRWNQPEVPHKGWTCFDVVDLGYEEYKSCQMCGNETVRFLHYMKHAEHPFLEVGCICAEKMSGDYVEPRNRERALRNRAKRRQTWRQQKWFISKNGNPCLRFKGTYITIYKTRIGHYGIIIRSISYSHYFHTIDAAKEAAFDFYEQVK